MAGILIQPMAGEAVEMFVGGLQDPSFGPVVFCGTQATPNADSYQLVFNDGKPEPLTMDATVDAACPEGASHSFRLPAERFTVGSHTLTIVATNAFGTTEGPIYRVVVGIRPGQFTITAIVGGGA